MANYDYESDVTQKNMPWRWVRVADHLRENDPDQLNELNENYRETLDYVYNLTGGIEPTPTTQLVDDITVTGYIDPLDLNPAGDPNTVQLSVEVLPPNATNKTVTWSSSDEDVATVNASGLVTAVAEGTARITATATDAGGVYGYKDIEVVDTTE